MKCWASCIFIALSLISLLCSAEVIDGPANIRIAPNGIVLFTLEDGVRVQNRKTDGGWFDIAVPVCIEQKGDFVDKEMNVVKKGVTLRDVGGRTIGVTQSQVRSLLAEDKCKQTSITVFVGGYTHRQNIRSNSVLEPQLAALLDERKSLSKSAFSAHVEELKYEKWISRDGFTSYINFNEPTDDPSPWPRAILFFYEDTLIAVYHEREITSKRIVSSAIIRGDTMSYVADVPASLRKKFSEIYYPLIENAD